MVTSILHQRDGKTYIGGMFTTVFQNPRPGLARLNLNGSLDLAFDPAQAFPASFDPAMLSLALQSDGRLWAGAEQSGSTEATQGSPCSGPDGQPEAGFAPTLSGDGGAITALAQDADGRLLVAGAFTTYNQQPRNHLARLHPDGTLDSTFRSRSQPETLGPGLVASTGWEAPGGRQGRGVG